MYIHIHNVCICRIQSLCIVYIKFVYGVYKVYICIYTKYTNFIFVYIQSLHSIYKKVHIYKVCIHVYNFVYVCIKKPKNQKKNMERKNRIKKPCAKKKVSILKEEKKKKTVRIKRKKNACRPETVRKKQKKTHTTRAPPPPPLSARRVSSRVGRAHAIDRLLAISKRITLSAHTCIAREEEGCPREGAGPGEGKWPKRARGREVDFSMKFP